MKINFTGNHYPIGRTPTGFHSLDVALRASPDKIGWPDRTLVEAYGPTGCGKTTFCLHILSILSQNMDNAPIACLDLEGQDEDMVSNVLFNSGYKASEFRWISAENGGDTEDVSDETLLRRLLDTLYEPSPYLGMLDSVASIAPVAEVKGAIGDANMGRRAYPMAQFTRGVIRALRTIPTPSSVVMTNHQYPKMEAIGMAKTYVRPGGEVKNNLGSLALHMKVPYVKYITSGDNAIEGRWDDCWILEGKVDKNRMGKKNSIFQVVVIGGQGLHPGLSAIVDCLVVGLAKVKGGNKIELDGVTYDSLKRIALDERTNMELFAPFINALKALQLTNGSVSANVETDQESEEPKKRGRPKK